jgi:hypothetical protein
LVIDAVVGTDADEGAQKCGLPHAEDEADGGAIAEAGEVDGGEFQLLDEGGDVRRELRVREPASGVVGPTVATVLQREGAVACCKVRQ